MYDAEKDVALTSCPVCNGPRSKKNVLKSVKITEKLSELLACDDIRERLEYRSDNYPNSQVIEQKNSGDKVYRDAFDGELYSKFVEKNLFENKHDIALKIDIDGFKSKFSSTKMIMVHCVILNYDISEVSKHLYFGLSTFYLQLNKFFYHIAIY